MARHTSTLGFMRRNNLIHAGPLLPSLQIRRAQEVAEAYVAHQQQSQEGAEEFPLQEVDTHYEQQQQEQQQQAKQSQPSLSGKDRNQLMTSNRTSSSSAAAVAGGAGQAPSAATAAAPAEGGEETRDKLDALLHKASHWAVAAAVLKAAGPWLDMQQLQLILKALQASVRAAGAAAGRFRTIQALGSDGWHKAQPQQKQQQQVVASLGEQSHEQGLDTQMGKLRGKQLQLGQGTENHHFWQMPQSDVGLRFESCVELSSAELQELGVPQKKQVANVLARYLSGSLGNGGRARGSQGLQTAPPPAAIVTVTGAAPTAGAQPAAAAGAAAGGVTGSAAAAVQPAPPAAAVTGAAAVTAPAGGPQAEETADVQSSLPPSFALDLLQGLQQLHGAFGRVHPQLAMLWIPPEQLSQLNLNQLGCLLSCSAELEQLLRASYLDGCLKAAVRGLKGGEVGEAVEVLLGLSR